jgi:hypothetical protein
MEVHRIRLQQCRAAETIEDEFQAQKAPDYLTGEKSADRGPTALEIVVQEPARDRDAN